MERGSALCQQIVEERAFHHRLVALAWHGLSTCRYCGDACTFDTVPWGTAALPQKAARTSKTLKVQDECPGINTALTYITDVTECTKPGAPACCFENTTCRYCGDACTFDTVPC